MKGIDGLSAAAALRGAAAGGSLEAAGRLRTLKEMEPQPGITLQPTPGERPDFGATLKEVLTEVNDLQLNSDRMMEQFAAGKVENLHDVLIAQQEASIAFRLVQEVRNKLLEGYQDLMRMQV